MITLPDDTTVYHAVYKNGSNEVFIIHVQEVLSFCKKKGYFKAYKKSRTNLQDCTTRHNQAKEKLQDAKNDPTTSKDRMKALKKSQELAPTAVLLATKLVLRRGKQIFSLHKMLLGESAQVKWFCIMGAQIGVANWTNLQGIVQLLARDYSVESFRDYVQFHLLSVFTYDAGEQQKY